MKLSRQKSIFTILLASIPVIFFLALEILLRLFDYGGNLDLFIAAPHPYTDYKQNNPNVAARYFYRQSTLPRSSNDIFLKDKPDNGYRIFVMGGSTALGFPYGNLLMFSRILHKRLEETFPEKRIEVINTALTAVNSYTLLDIMDGILKEKPDAVLIYAGHNEYYGALGVASLESAGRNRWLVLTVLKLARYRTFILMRNIFGPVVRWSGKILHKTEYNPFGTLMERLVTERDIPYKGPLYRRGLDQFEKNLTAIFSKAHKAGVTVLISELVSNIADMKPFISHRSDSRPSADDVFARAAQHEQRGDYEQAKSAYSLARDLDALRFRASEDFNAVVRKKAGEFGIPVVPMLRYFETASTDGLVGDNLMVDHLHPNSDGYFVMADAFYESMRENGLIAASWDSARILPAAGYMKRWPVTSLDSTIASFIIAQLKGSWPFKPKFTENRTLLDFKPRTVVETLALKVIFGEINAAEAHLALAGHYEKQKDRLQAKREYDALSYILFIEAYSLLNRAQSLMRMSKNEDALALLLESLQKEEIPLAYRLVGEIYLEKQDYTNALHYLEKANAKTPRHPDILYSLCLAYAGNGEKKKADEILRQMTRLFPGDERVGELQRSIAN